MVDEVGMWVVLNDWGDELASIAIFHVLQSHFYVDPITFALNNSFLKVRSEKEAWGCIKIPPMKHSFFESSDLYLMMKGQWCDIISVLYILEEPV